MAKKKPLVEKPIEEFIVPSTLDDMMGERFNIYAKDVIQDRAIPDARDGMKPVQRRIIYAMYQTGNTIAKPTKKCAHIVGEVMGNYHPHGDSSIYDALVRMSQTWRVRAPLVDFQGNNGSMDGDGPAAYRYTEARLAALSEELIRDIDKDTVDMGLTFDDTRLEPIVLPSRFPNLLVNGTSGIAVGMATEIPPHNLGEVVDTIIYRIEHPHCPMESLMARLPGPDFPTGGILYKSQGLLDMYLTGRGKVDIASRVHIEEHKDGTSSIIVTEIPYNVVKSSLVFAIDKIRHDKTIAGIEEVRDETDKEGIRIVIDVKEGFKPEAILAYLNSKTQLRSSYSANMVAIVNGRPQTMTLLSYCDTYIAHQVEVIMRRSEFNLKKDRARLEIVEGLIKASSLIDQIVAVIKASHDKADSKANIMKEFGFSEPQAEAIVTMPLYKLSKFDVNVVLDEKKALDGDIAELLSILSDPAKRDRLIISDLKAIVKKYSDARRTSIEEEDTSKRVVDKADLVAKESVYVAVTRDGYLKRSSIASWRSSNGPAGAMPGMKAGDTLLYSGLAESTDFLLAFTDKGNYLYLPIHELKVNKWNDEGVHANNLLKMNEGEKIIRAFVVRVFREDLFVCLVSRKGLIKRTKLSNFPVTRCSHPIRAMKLLVDDEVVSVLITSGNSNLFLASVNGMAVYYNENEVPVSLTSSSGVKAGSFKGEDVADALCFDKEEQGKILLLTNRGYTRVFSLSNINLSERLSKATTLYKTFKNEPHLLVYLDKLGGKEAPLTYFYTDQGGTPEKLLVEDLYLTPMDKVAKGGVKNFEPKKAVSSVYRTENILITSDTVSHLNEAPVKEVSTKANEPDESAMEAVAILKREEEKPAEKFEQISIFGDDDLDI